MWKIQMREEVIVGICLHILISILYILELVFWMIYSFYRRRHTNNSEVTNLSTDTNFRKHPKNCQTVCVYKKYKANINTRSECVKTVSFFIQRSICSHILMGLFFIDSSPTFFSRRLIKYTQGTPNTSTGLGATKSTTNRDHEIQTPI